MTCEKCPVIAWEKLLQKGINSVDEKPSKMNHDDNPFQTKNLPSANEAFGSNLNEKEDDDEMPF